MLLAIESFVFGQKVWIAHRFLDEKSLRTNLSKMLEDVLKGRERLPNQRKCLHLR